MTGRGVEGVQGPRAREDVVFRSVAGDWVLYDPRSQDVHVLTVTAAAVWACCDGSLGPDAIAAEVAEHLDGAPSPDVVRQDVANALEQFRASGLLE